MLYDPKWEVQTRPDVFSLESLIAWLETMPAGRRYDYWNCNGRCLYGQYTHAMGVPWDDSGHFSKDDENNRGEFCGFVYTEVACLSPHTFGGALTRAREALASRA